MDNINYYNPFGVHNNSAYDSGIELHFKELCETHSYYDFDNLLSDFNSEPKPDERI